MASMLKLIDPEARYTWTHPEDDSVVFTYKALAGPLLNPDIAESYLNGCITRAEGVVLPDGSTVWEGEPPINWAAVLPVDVASALFIKIANITQLTDDEAKNSPSPLGLQSSEKPGIAADASGEPATETENETGSE